GNTADRRTGGDDQRHRDHLPEEENDEGDNGESDRERVYDRRFRHKVGRADEDADHGHGDATDETLETGVARVAQEQRRGQNGEKHGGSEDPDGGGDRAGNPVQKE